MGAKENRQQFCLFGTKTAWGKATFKYSSKSEKFFFFIEKYQITNNEKINIENIPCRNLVENSNAEKKIIKGVNNLSSFDTWSRNLFVLTISRINVFHVH